VGVGGFGVVYEAIDLELGGTVALKALQRITSDSLIALKQEFRALADVSHPNLVALYELSEHEGHWFFTMEFLDGTDFLSHVRVGRRERDEVLATIEIAPESEDRLRSPRAYPSSAGSKQLDAQRLRLALPQLFEGVAGLHQLGMLHRDIKPSNVMVTREGRVVLLDFGLVRPAASTDAVSGRVLLDAPNEHTSTAIVGTPEYMSPEQSIGDALTPASDWYSVGTLLFEALTGRRPFVGTIAEIVAERQYNEPPAPEAFAQGLPKDLCELCEALLQREPARRPNAGQIARMVGAHQGVTLNIGPSTPTSGKETLVGREELFTALRSALSDTAAGHPVVAEVYGASGVGKSALVAKFLDEARRQRSALVLTGRCDERKSVPFKALDSVMDALSVHLRSRPLDELAVLLPKAMDELGQLFPVLVVDETQAPKRDRAEPLSAPSWTRAAAGKPAEDDALATPREAAFAALRELLVRVSALRPVVIAVDDLQWGDDDSATLLRELLTGPDAPNVLFVATLRGAPRHVVTPFDSVESSSLDRRVIDVSPLTHRDAVGLARRLLGKRADGRDNSDEAERIAHEAAGNPFFLGELARYSAEHPDADASRSIGLKDVVRARVAALAPEPRALLELIAVIGQPVPQRVIFDASNLGAQAYPALRALRAANMVRIAGAKEADSIEPYHDRIRETVVSELAPAVLRARHKALADALEARPESEPGLKAEHLAGAGELAAAAKAALEAAHKADRAFAFERSARWYEAAITWGEAKGSARAELLARMAHALASCGRNGAAAETFIQAADLVDDRIRSIELRRNGGVQFFIDGRHDDGVRAVGAVADQLGVSIPSNQITLGASLAADTMWIRLRGTRFRERPASAIDADTLQRLDLYHHAGMGTAFANSLLSMFYLTRFMRTALEVGEPVRVGLGLLRYSTTLAVVGPSNEHKALDVLRQAEELSMRCRDPYLRGCIDMGYGFTDLMVGRWSQAIARCERALDVLTKVPGAVWDADTAASLITEALVNQGKIAQAFRGAARQERDAKERNFIAGLVRSALRWESLRRVMNHDVSGAHAVIEDAARRIPSSAFLFGHFLEILGRTQLAIYEGESDRTLPWLRERWPKLERSMMLSAQVFRVASLNALGGVALTAARAQRGYQRDELLKEVTAIGAKLEREPGMMARARGLSLRAASAAIGGDDRAALSLYRAALQGFETADMHLHAAATRLAVGRIVGGDEGAALLAQGQKAFTDQGVRRPAQFASVFVTQPLA
jgi:serine/threonine protein kinase/tetratricopeptide (TPR) repeat protein